MPLIDKRYICTTEKYTSNGEEKTMYFRLGEIVTISTKDGGQFQKVKLYQNPAQELVLTQDPRFKEDQQAPTQQELPANW